VRDPATAEPILSTPEVESAPSVFRYPPWLSEWANTSKRRRVLSELAACDAEVRRSRDELVAAVKKARVAGASWQAVGLLVGISGEGARRRFGS
jgi:hypothetical protein